MNIKGKIFTFFGLIIAAALAAALVFEFDIPSRSQKETVMILRGQNALQIANDLKAEGYIKSKIAFMAQVIQTGNLRKLKAGEYDFTGLSQAEIIDRLVRAQSVAKFITVTPGEEVGDIAASFAKIGVPRTEFLNNIKKPSLFAANFDFLKDLPASASLEGYLFPDSYQIPEIPTADSAVVMMLQNFDKKLTPDLRDQIIKQKKTIFDIVTMASMIEKEVITLEDKKIVSGILWKRLKIGMPLQVDSTVLYGTGGTFDKESNNSYNTYRAAGLPAGPICNPGLDSIEAAIFPQDSPYLYYLSAKDGTTVFAKTYGEHLINKAKYLD